MTAHMLKCTMEARRLHHYPFCLTPLGLRHPLNPEAHLGWLGFLARELTISSVGLTGKQGQEELFVLFLHEFRIQTQILILSVCFLAIEQSFQLHSLF